MPKISTIVIVLVVPGFLVLAAHSTGRVLSAPPAQSTVTTPVLPAPPAKSTPTPTLGITPAPGDRTYTVAAGDNPWQIATKMYGNGFFYKYILDANRLTESSILRIGMVLVVPPLPTATAVGTVARKQTVTATVTLTATVAVSASAVTASPPVTFTATAAAAPIVAGAATPETAALTGGPESTPPLPTASEGYSVSPPVVETPVASKTAAQDPLTAALRQAAAYPGMPAVLDVLGWLCAIGSLVCAWQSYQTYHRMRILRRMMIMSARARARL